MRTSLPAGVRTGASIAPVLLLLSWALAPLPVLGQGGASSGGGIPDLQRTAREIVESTNRFRREQGLAPVDPDPVLTETARRFAEYMARTGRFGHEADGSRPADRAERQGYEICLLSENIAYQFDSRGFTAEGLASKTVAGWKESPGHRRNMVEPHVTGTGVGVARSSGNGRYYAVQLFGRPKSESIRFTIANEAATAASYRLDGERFELPPRYRRTHEQCRPVELTFDPSGGRKGKTVRPGDGDAFAVVSGDDGGLSLKEGR